MITIFCVTVNYME